MASRQQTTPRTTSSTLFAEPPAADDTEEEPAAVTEEETSEEQEEDVDPEVKQLQEETAALEATLKEKRRALALLQDIAEDYTTTGYARKVAEMENMRRARRVRPRLSSRHYGTTCVFCLCVVRLLWCETLLLTHIHSFTCVLRVLGVVFWDCVFDVGVFTTNGCCRGLWEP